MQEQTKIPLMESPELIASQFYLAEYRATKKSLKYPNKKWCIKIKENFLMPHTRAVEKKVDTLIEAKTALMHLDKDYVKLCGKAVELLTLKFPEKHVS